MGKAPQAVEQDDRRPAWIAVVQVMQPQAVDGGVVVDRNDLRGHGYLHAPFEILRSAQNDRGKSGMTGGNVPVVYFGHQEVKEMRDRKSTRLNSSHDQISYAVFCLKKKKVSANAC